MKQKKLYVVLLRSKTVLSNLIHFTTQDEYTHASIALDINLEYMFSFGRRHTHNPFIACFRREELDNGLYGCHKYLPGIILELTVTECQYNKAKSIIENFLINSHCYDYNYVGLIKGLFGIPHDRHNSFLCSEFVYYVLSGSGICPAKDPQSIIRPQSFLSLDAEPIFKGNLKEYERTAKAETLFNFLFAN